MRKQIQKFGSAMSSMIIPNLGAFLAWGLLTALGIALKNEALRVFIVPMLNYMLPLLIAFAAGRMIYEYRGGVIAVVATMGCILGADITMFIGAMIMGPIAALILKKFDELIDGKIPSGFELLVNNFSIGIIGAGLSILSMLYVAPAISSLTAVMAGGVDFLIHRGLLPLTAIFIEPAKVIFLNNAIGQGILTPLGTTQLEELGKSVLFLLESNPGPGLGILLAYVLFGKGNSKASASGASVIHFFGGIHEIYFPFVLMNPILVVALIAGGLTSSFLFGIFKVGLVGVASPGSIISILIMAAAGDRIKITIAILAGAAVSLLVAAPLVKRFTKTDEDLVAAAEQMESLKGKQSRIRSVFMKEGDFAWGKVQKIIYACDAGLGSSAMGASILKKKLKEAGLEDISVQHVAISELPVGAELMVVHSNLAERAKEKEPNAVCIEIFDYLAAPEYDELVERIRKDRG